MQTNDTLFASAVQAAALPPAPPRPDFHFDDLQCAIVEIVRRYDRVSFAELPRRLADVGMLVSEGQCTIGIPGNIIFWQGMPPMLVGAILRLLHAGRLHLHPASEWDYMTDGAVLDLPIARLARVAYRRPHWLPVCLRLVPPQSKSSEQISAGSPPSSPAENRSIYAMDSPTLNCRRQKRTATAACQPRSIKLRTTYQGRH